MSEAEIADLTAARMARLFRSRELSPVEAAKACLARIRLHNEKVNAYCWLREEETLAEARRAEQRYITLEPLGPLDGVPVAVKEIFLMRGWPNRKGSKVIAAGLSDEDSPAIAGLRRNGFVPLGLTTTPEFGWKGVTDSPLTGITRNPWDPGRTAGGSSGGTAAAVALGMGPIGLGTDAGGSIRIPAGFCGIVGHKPTHGLAPMWPPSAFWPLAHVGPMAWTVEDGALLLDILAQPDTRDATLPPPSQGHASVLQDGVAGLSMALSIDLGYVDVDAEVAAAVKAAAAVLEELGAVVDAEDPGFADPLEAFGRLFFGGAANALRDLGPGQRAEMDPALIEEAEKAEKRSMLDYLAAMNERAALLERMGRFHRRHDLLLTPSVPIAAFEAGREVPPGWAHERWPTWTPFTYPFNLTGQPAISVPCGFTRKGLPIGLQIVGARHRDDLVLRAAHAYQMAQPLTDRRPRL